MKTFQEFMQESSLSRIKSKSDKGGMAALSASRGDKSAKENRARAKQLDKDLRGRGLGGATKVTGSYMEKDKTFPILYCPSLCSFFCLGPSCPSPPRSQCTVQNEVWPVRDVLVEKEDFIGALAKTNTI